jgi:hypothetical protein
MITELNVLNLLTPAFNKSLLKVASDQTVNEKFQYLLDTLLNEFEAINVFNASQGYPAYAGFSAFSGGLNASQYVAGDSVAIFDTNTGVHTGLHRVLAVPDDSTIIMDTVWGGPTISNGQIFIWKIKRNKLPASPEGTATFNVNSFAPSLVGSDFEINNVGFFNVPSNWEAFKYLVHEEFYAPISFTAISGISIGGFINVARVTGTSYQPELGQIVTITQDSGAEYNGTWEVIYISGTDEFVISSSYITTVGTGSAGMLPKLSTSDFNIEDISNEFLVFNGALPFPKDINFDWTKYDATQGNLTPAKFLTTIPNDTKVRINDKGYIQFFQSDRNSVTQYYVEVIDEMGFNQIYIVGISPQNSNDFVQGVSVGIGDLNAIPLSNIISLPQRGLPIIQECDKSYEVYLYGNSDCGVSGTQTVQFQHPMGLQTINPSYWNSNGWTSVKITVAFLKINGITQPLGGTNPKIWSKNGWLFQPAPYENLYANAIKDITGLNIMNATEIDALVPYSLFGSPMSIEINFDEDFEMQTFMELPRRFGNPTQIYKVPPATVISIYYKWDSSLCKWEYRSGYRQKGGGFVGLNGNLGTEQVVLSEKKRFQIDWSCCTYTGARLIFEDRLGSMAGFNFNLKNFEKLNVSSDAYEQESFDINRTNQNRGFDTIQYSYDKAISLNSDWIRQIEMDYLEEAMTSPNCFVQIENEVFPAVIVPKSKVLQSKENNGLIRITLEVKINGTQFSQRN